MGGRPIRPATKVHASRPPQDTRGLNQTPEPIASRCACETLSHLATPNYT